MPQGIGLHRLAILVLLGTCTPWAAGQESPAPTAPEPATSLPADSGIRFTPGMARAFGALIAREAMVNRYGLDKAREQEVAEKIARRIMRMAHANDKQAREILEYALPELLVAQAHGGEESISREFWQDFAKRAGPVAPAFRQLLTDIRQDVQPLLAPTQQFKMAGDLLAMGAALDAFEKTMERWSKGDVNPGENPFDTGDHQVKKDADGESTALKDARKRATEQLNNSWRSSWQQFVEQAAKLYGFDEAQLASADSILREAVQRSEGLTRNETWRRRALRNRLWSQFIWNIPGARVSPLQDFIWADLFTVQEPLRAIGDEFRERIDKIPTQPQREAAEARARAALAEIGVDIAAIDPKE